MERASFMIEAEAGERGVSGPADRAPASRLAATRSRLRAGLQAASLRRVTSEGRGASSGSVSSPALRQFPSTASPPDSLSLLSDSSMVASGAVTFSRM